MPSRNDDDIINKFKQWGFQPLMTGLLGLLTYYAAETNSQMKEMRREITQLTVQASINKTDIQNLKDELRIRRTSLNLTNGDSSIYPHQALLFKHEEEYDVKKYLKTPDKI